MDRFDVVVVGLGVHGSAIAAALARRGLRVAGVERSPRGEVWGASAGPWRMLRTTDPQRPQLTELAREARRRWHEVSERQSTPLIRKVSAVLVGPRPVDAVNHHARGHHIDPDDGRLAGLAPRVRALGAVVDPECALLDAVAAVRALQVDATDVGAQLYFGQTVDLTLDLEAPIRLRLADTDIRANIALICVGAWAVDLPARVRPFGLRIEPAYMQLAHVNAGTGLDLDCFYLLESRSDRFCVIPSDGAVQFGHFTAQAAQGGSSLEMSYAAGQRDLAALRRVIPKCRHVTGYTTIAGAYTFTVDDAFVLHRSSQSVATLIACSAVGFKYAPALAERVASVVVEDRWVDVGRLSKAGGNELRVTAATKA